MRMPNKILLRCRCRARRDGNGQRAVNRQAVGTAARYVGQLLILSFCRNGDGGRKRALLLECGHEPLGYDLRCRCTTASRCDDGDRRNDGNKNSRPVKYRRTVLVGHERLRLVCRASADPFTKSFLVDC